MNKRKLLKIPTKDALNNPNSLIKTPRKKTESKRPSPAISEMSLASSISVCSEVNSRVVFQRGGKNRASEHSIKSKKTSTPSPPPPPLLKVILFF